jgi:hypothetical protein
MIINLWTPFFSFDVKFRVPTAGQSFTEVQ